MYVKILFIYGLQADSVKENLQINQIMEDVKTYLYDGFYFSYGYDLTCSRQRRIKWM